MDSKYTLFTHPHDEWDALYKDGRLLTVGNSSDMFHALLDEGLVELVKDVDFFREGSERKYDDVYQSQDELEIAVGLKPEPKNRQLARLRAEADELLKEIASLEEGG